MANLTKQEIENKVVDILTDKLGVERENIKADTDFISELGVDSLDCVELVMELEHEFGIRIPDEKAEATKNLADTVKLVSDLL